MEEETARRCAGVDRIGEPLELHALLVQLANPESTSLFTLAGLEYEAQQLMGVRVSVLTPGFLPPKFRDRVLEAAEPL